MKILILGGTRFLGRHLVEAALARGHDVTLFHRGETNPELFPQLEHLLGDRTRDLSALRGRKWDAVIDTCGYTPPAVTESTRLLAPMADHYTFISTISVYSFPLDAGADESAPVVTLPEGASVDEMTFDNYGELKVLCERQVEEFFSGRSLVVRAGLLVGPHDPTDRFTYWIDRLAAGGIIAAPAAPERRVQLIHAGDLSEWIVHMVEMRASGIYNATGPQRPLGIGELLTRIERTLAAKATIEWIPEAFLLEHEVAPWSDLPLWLPSSQNSFMEVSIERAVGAGLSFRPLEQTIRETHEWHVGRAPRQELKAGVSRDREAEILRAWRGLNQVA